MERVSFSKATEPPSWQHADNLTSSRDVFDTYQLSDARSARQDTTANGYESHRSMEEHTNTNHAHSSRGRLHSHAMTAARQGDSIQNRRSRSVPRQSQFQSAYLVPDAAPARALQLVSGAMKSGWLLRNSTDHASSHRQWKRQWVSSSALIWVQAETWHMHASADICGECLP